MQIMGHVMVPLLFIMSGVFLYSNCFESVLQCLNMCFNIMLENETDFEFLKKLKRKRKKICKKTINAHTKYNARGSFETNNWPNNKIGLFILHYAKSITHMGYFGSQLMATLSLN